MKWNAPKTGDVRILTKFAWLPITCYVVGEDRKETRWLCFVKIRQRYETNFWFNDGFY
jgi:hypothetical protein